MSFVAVLCAGVVLLDENLKEINLKSPLSVPAAEYAQLKAILENDTSELLRAVQGWMF